jgi:hypothetical protein
MSVVHCFRDTRQDNHSECVGFMDMMKRQHDVLLDDELTVTQHPARLVHRNLHVVLESIFLPDDWLDNCWLSNKLGSAGRSFDYSQLLLDYKSAGAWFTKRCVTVRALLNKK